MRISKVKRVARIPSTPLLDFPAMLRVVRGWLGEDQATFGRRVGVSNRTVGRWEHGDNAMTHEAISVVIQTWPLVVAGMRPVNEFLAAKPCKSNAGLTGTAKRRT